MIRRAIRGRRVKEFLEDASSDRPNIEKYLHSYRFYYTTRPNSNYSLNNVPVKRPLHSFKRSLNTIGNIVFSSI